MSTFLPNTNETSEKNDVPTPDEIMRKLDDVLLNVYEVKCLLEGKDVPCEIVGNDSSP